MTIKKYAKVIVDVPTMQTNEPYSYKIPEALIDLVEIGMRVRVPFGQANREIVGFVVDIVDELDVLENNILIKDIIDTVDLEKIFNQELIELGKHIAKSDYDFNISIFQAMIPAGLKVKYQKRVVKLTDIVDEDINLLFADEKEIDYDDAWPANIKTKLKKLKGQTQVDFKYVFNTSAKRKKELIYKANLNNIKEIKSEKLKQLAEFLQTEQKKSYKASELKKKKFSDYIIKKAVTENILKKEYQEIYREVSPEIKQTTDLALNAQQEKAYREIISAKKNDVFLLEGITGSGKTEVYLQAAREIVRRGKKVLFLVPEIALTPQMVNRVKGRFGKKTAVLHSALSVGEKYDEWRRIKEGSVDVVVGARSAIFAPLEDIGLIIIDEEHETTYKQAENPHYHARDVALWRGKYWNAPVLLGSATPSLESRARAMKGVYQLLLLNKRAVNNAQLPKVKIVDMKDDVPKYQESNFSEQLKNSIQERLAKNEQVILMLNRRGYSSFVMCRDCGYVPKDKNCDISLTMHLNTQTMKCHYCGHEEAIPKICANCGSKAIRYYGTGTEKVEKELNNIFPKARIIRVDQDTVSKKHSLDNMLLQFANHEADILLGTQMIAKGLDFPNVTLVGVINADTALNLPDFRNSEKTFQLLTQVSGRAGRSEKKGEVIIQTYNPEHYAIKLAKKHDYESFFVKEMQIRRLGGYSPYYYLTKIQITHENKQQAAKRIYEIYQWLQKKLHNEVIMLGPSPKPIARLKNRYYFQIILKYKNEHLINKYLNELLNRAQVLEKEGIRLTIDRESNDFI